MVIGIDMECQLVWLLEGIMTGDGLRPAVGHLVNLRQLHAKVAGLSGIDDHRTRRVEGEPGCSVDCHADRLRIRPRTHQEIELKPLLIAVVDDVDSGIYIAILHALPGGKAGLPFSGIVALDMIDFSRQFHFRHGSNGASSDKRNRDAATGIALTRKNSEGCFSIGERDGITLTARHELLFDARPMPFEPKRQLEVIADDWFEGLGTGGRTLGRKGSNMRSNGRGQEQLKSSGAHWRS